MNWRVRLKAAGIHLISCLVVAAIAASVVLFVWYPWPYRIVSGGETLLFLLMTVDIIMGPLITFAIFNLKKPRKELKRDLSIIVTLQVAALAFGLHTVYLARPAVLALEVDRFRVTTAIDVAEEEFASAEKGFQSLSMTGPQLVDTRDPRQEERYDAIVKGLGGADLGTRPSFWRHWNQASRARTLKYGKSVAEWLARHPDDAAEVIAAVARTGRPADQLLYLPMLARRADWSVLVDKATGDPVGFAPINVT